MNFRPCIDIHNGRVKQIVGGSLSQDSSNIIENFVSDEDASFYAELFKKDKLFGGHIIMLGPNNQEQALKALKSYPNGMQIGGGITSQNAAFFLEMGASHVVVTSYIFKDGRIDFNNLEQLVSEVGKERLVLDLSCKKKDGNYYVMTDRWQKFTDFKVNKENLKFLSGYCDEFLVHAVDVEGKRNGIQMDLVELLGYDCGITVTYAGGINSIDDIDIINDLGQNRVNFTVGSALDIFGGNLRYTDIVEYCRSKEG